MKKTVTINISGIFFHIDEDAYETLSKYLDAISSYFSNSEGKDEIIEDIEARISEILQAKLNENKQVITLEDIDEVIDTMGQPEQVAGDEGASPTNQKKADSTTRNKRLFRDPDNKVIGGVCSGIGEYFKVDAVWIRIAFIVALLFLGTGPLIYIILWIVIPSAFTTAEKLEMRGEPVNVSNIGKSINEEIGHIKEKVKDLKNDAKFVYRKGREAIPQNLFERIVAFCFLIIKYVFRTISIIVGAILIVIGIFLITGFIGSFFQSNEIIYVSSTGISNFSLPVLLKIFFNSSQLITIATIGLSLFIGIPLITLVYIGTKMIFEFRLKTRIVGISSFSLWVVGLILCMFVALNILHSFSSKSVITKKYSIFQPYNKMISLDIKTTDTLNIFNNERSRFALGQWNIISINHKVSRFGIPKLEIVKSDNDSTQIIAYFTARGSDKSESVKIAEKIIYHIQIKDTLVQFDPYFRLPENEKWRGQQLRLVLKVPVGKMLNICHNMEMILSDFENDEKDNSELANKQWIMQESGLKEYNPIYIPVMRDSTTKVNNLK